MTYIESGAFYGCASLPDIHLPDNLSLIFAETFHGCTGLTSVSIPNSVTYIGAVAFCDCVGLTSVTIPGNVTNICRDAFSDCTGLTSVYSKNPTPPEACAWAAFGSSTYNTATLYVPKGSADAYKSAAGWREFKNIVEE